MCSFYTRKREFVFVEALVPVQCDPVVSEGLKHPPCPVAGPPGGLQPPEPICLPAPEYDWVDV